MSNDFFYSPSLQLYISRKPLKMEGRVKAAAQNAGIRLEWDDEGRINQISYDDAKRLLGQLGSSMLSAPDYWQAMEDAKRTQDIDMVGQLMSNRYAEWIDTVFLRGGKTIHHPIHPMIEEGKIEKGEYIGEKRQSRFPPATPGWFNPEGNIEPGEGVPIKVELNREKFATSWKYWSPNHDFLEVCTLLRGYVTSVGKPSWDLGMPPDSRQPMQMVRECRREPLQPEIERETMSEAERLLQESKKGYGLSHGPNEKEDKCLEELVRFIKEHGNKFSRSYESDIYGTREQFFDRLGMRILENKNDSDKDDCNHGNDDKDDCRNDHGNRSDGRVKETIEAARELWKPARIRQMENGTENKKEIGTGSEMEKKGAIEKGKEEFISYVKDASRQLKEALASDKDIVFVMGHKNPDTDSVVTALFEAWRNHILDGDRRAYIPIVQATRLPDEVSRLMGMLDASLPQNIMLSDNPLYAQAKESGIARWISVDQNHEPDVQKYFIALIDHHILCETAKNQEIPKTWRMIGSSAALVALKYLGMGISLDADLAKTIYGATLMDTENRVEHKMTDMDKGMMDHLKMKSGMEEDSGFYRELMSHLLNTDDAELLFRRDYKEDWGFGFGEAKVKGCFSKEGHVMKESLVARLKTLADRNNSEKNLPLTIMKITDYEEDNETVNRERVYLLFNEQASSHFKETTTDLVERIIRFEFPTDTISRGSDHVDFWGTGMQLSRKKTAPVLEPIVRAFNQYFHSPGIDRWVKRDFLKRTNNVCAAFPEASADDNGRIHYVSYPEAKMMGERLEFSILSLPEYWTVLRDAKAIKDRQMTDSLQGSNFVEFMDTAIIGKSGAIHHPNIEGDRVSGDRIPLIIPSGNPGLIDPEDIDLSTGIPKKVFPPNIYGKKGLWRYWQPDADLVIPCRSYIFLLGQPCWDGKFHMKDSFPNLGIRPVVKEPPIPTIKMYHDKHHLTTEITIEGDTLKKRWSKNIFENQ